MSKLPAASGSSFKLIPRFKKGTAGGCALFKLIIILILATQGAITPPLLGNLINPIKHTGHLVIASVARVPLHVEVHVSPSILQLLR